MVLRGLHQSCVNGLQQSRGAGLLGVLCLQRLVLNRDCSFQSGVLDLERFELLAFALQNGVCLVQLRPK